mmetsp:Transcript_88389/g.249049  ORF Transcript_88389/g.249049 Transcript_88389/m.249049 type:complete len:81 (+) Transcript_88389:967-1209(+)
MAVAAYKCETAVQGRDATPLHRQTATSIWNMLEASQRGTNSLVRHPNPSIFPTCFFSEHLNHLVLSAPMRCGNVIALYVG